MKEQEENGMITYVIFYGNSSVEKAVIVTAESYSQAEAYARALSKTIEQDDSTYWLIDVYDITNEGHIDLLEKQQQLLSVKERLNENY